MAEKTIDTDKTREMRRLLASEGGAEKVRQRYGDGAVHSPEFRLAQRQNAAVRNRQQRLAQQSAGKDRNEGRDEKHSLDKDTRDDAIERQRDAERDKKALQHRNDRERSRDSDRSRGR